MRTLRLTYLPDALPAVLFVAFAAFASSPSISDDQLQLIVDCLAESAQRIALPPPHTAPKPTAAFASANLTVILDIARNAVRKLWQISNSSSSQNNVTLNSDDDAPKPELLVANGDSTGDPASLGVSVLLANWTLGSSDDGLDYASAAASQLQYLLEVVARPSDGAISHRTSEAQLWSDFIYMVPPFLAHYGAITSNLPLLQLAHTHTSLSFDSPHTFFRTLEAPSTWKRPDTDDGHWSTGNGWAAAGTLRVLATMEHLDDSGMKNSLKNERADLNAWVGEILDGMYKSMPDSGLFHNYADNTSTFQDGSSTALIAASTYRLALLTQTYRHLPNAEKCRTALSSNGHIDSSEWLNPVVNPLDWSSEGTHSPEGQAFVVEMQSAWKDWVAQGSPGKNAARPTLSSMLSRVSIWSLIWALGVGVGLM